MVMGLRGGGYRIRDYATGKEREVLPIKTGDTPIVSFLKDDDNLLLQIDQNIGIFVDQECGLVTKNTLPWSGQLKCCCISCGSYILGLLEDTVEVISLVDQKVVQKINLPGASGLLEAPGGNRAIVYNNKAINFLVPAPIKIQIKQCIQHLRIEKAFQLLSQADHDPTKQEKRELHTEAGFALLNDLNFKQAFDHFESSSVDPRDLINLFPRVRPSQLKWNQEHENCPLDDVATLISKGIVDKLNRVHSDESKDGERRLRDEHENEATSQLGRFLWQRREYPSEGLEIKGAELKLWVDTALLKLHVFLASRKVIRPFPLFRLLEKSNSCLLEECDHVLVRNHQYNDLALLYRSNGKISKGLSVLLNMGSGKFKDPNSDGITLTCDILTNMEASRDLWIYSRWVLLKAPQQAMRIFTSKSRNVSLDSDRVLDHLENVSVEAARENDSEFNYMGKYLEFLVYDLNLDDAKYHNLLGRNYLKQIAKNKEKEDEVELKIILEEFFKFISFSNVLDATSLLEEAEEVQLSAAVLALNKKLERHKDVLLALAFSGPNDEGHEEAVNYCLEANDESEERSNRFLALLDVYFYHRPPDRPQEDVWNLALDIMEFYHGFMEPTKVLELVPKEMTMNNLTNYLESVIQHIIGTQRQTSIVKALYKTQYMQNTMKLYSMKSEYHIINQYKVCCFCRKPLLVSVFWSYPNRDLVHHACREKYEKMKNDSSNSSSPGKLRGKTSHRLSEEMLDSHVDENVESSANRFVRPRIRQTRHELVLDDTEENDDFELAVNPFLNEEARQEPIPRKQFKSQDRFVQEDSFKRERTSACTMNPFRIEPKTPFAARKQQAKNPFRIKEKPTITNPFKLDGTNPFDHSSSNPASALTNVDNLSTFL